MFVAVARAHRPWSPEDRSQLDQMLSWTAVHAPHLQDFQFQLQESVHEGVMSAFTL